MKICHASNILDDHDAMMMLIGHYQYIMIMILMRLKLGSGVGWRSDNRHFRILAGCGAGATRRKFLGYDSDSVEPIFCHYADVSRLGT